jgi:FMN phosphatase YigB (HAD superfamily)
MIGDNPETDVKGARALAMQAILVGAATWVQAPRSPVLQWRSSPAIARSEP